MEESIDNFRRNIEELAYNSGWKLEYVVELELLTIFNLLGIYDKPETGQLQPTGNSEEFEEKIKGINDKIHDMKKQGREEASQEQGS